MLRKIFTIGFALLVCVAFGGYLLLFPPLPFPPEIGRGLPSAFSDADKEFARRVAIQFPMPITEAELAARLEDQEFTVDLKNGNAHFEKTRFPCTLIWRVYWKTLNGSASDLGSKYGGSCL